MLYQKRDGIIPIELNTDTGVMRVGDRDHTSGEPIAMTSEEFRNSVQDILRETNPSYQLTAIHFVSPIKLEDAKDLFDIPNQKTAIHTITGLENIDTSEVTDM
jgi:hypothetical protein